MKRRSFLQVLGFGVASTTLPAMAATHSIPKQAMVPSNFQKVLAAPLRDEWNHHYSGEILGGIPVPTTPDELNEWLAAHFDVHPDVGVSAHCPTGLPYVTYAVRGDVQNCVQWMARTFATRIEEAPHIRGSRLYWRLPFAYQDGRLRGRLVIQEMHKPMAVIEQAPWQRPVFDGLSVMEPGESVEMCVRIPESREGQDPICVGEGGVVIAPPWRRGPDDFDDTFLMGA